MYFSGKASLLSSKIVTKAVYINGKTRTAISKKN